MPEQPKPFFRFWISESIKSKIAQPGYSMKFYLFLIAFVPLFAFGQTPCRLNLGKDPATVCRGAAFVLNPDPPAPGGQYTWGGGPGLSCSTCASPTLTLNTAGIFTYTVSYVNGTCAIKDTLTVQVQGGQQPVYNLIADMIACRDAFVNLGGPAFLGNTYNWFTKDGSFSASSANPTAGPIGQPTTFYVSVQNPSCPFPVLDSVAIGVAVTPTIQVQKDTAVCKGNPVVLGRTVPQTGTTYKWIPEIGLDNASSPNPKATPAQRTTYTLTATLGDCSTTRSVTVTPIDLDLNLNVGDTVGLCAGKSVQIQTNISLPNVTLAWSPQQDLQLTSGGFAAIATPASDITYTLVGKTPGCERTRQVFVKVNTLPSKLAIEPSDTTLCQGNSAVLRVQFLDPLLYPGIQHQWMPVFGQIGPTNQPEITVKPATTTRYTRTTTFGGCSVTVETSVNVVPLPFLEATPASQTICTGESVQLGVSYQPGIFNLQWSPADGLNCTNCENPVAKPALTTTYVVTGQSDRCPASDTLTITVSEKPFFAFPQRTEICIGDTVLLNNALVDPITTYEWTSSLPNFGTIAAPQPKVVPHQTATFYVLAKNKCGVEQGQVNIFVSDGQLRTQGDTTICRGSKATLRASGAFPGSYLWSTGQSTQVISVFPQQTTDYVVQYTYPGPCILKDTVRVRIQGANAALNLPTDAKLCPKESIALNLNPTPTAIYNWTSIPPGYTSTDPSPTVNPDQTTRYVVSTKLGDCSTTDTVMVEVFTGSLSLGPDQSICAGDPVELSATATASTNNSFLWSNGRQSSRITVRPTRDSTYIMVFSFGDTCTLRDTVKVNVRRGFEDVDLVTDPDTSKIFAGDSLMLQALIRPAQSLNGFKFEWTQNGVPFGGNSDFVRLDSISADPPARLLKVVVTGPNGCVRSDTFSVTVCPDIIVFPNAFTPGNDDLNDAFRMVVLGGHPKIQKMRIFNRWGQLVFESTEPKASWDGKIEDQEAPSDSYLYIIEYRLGDGTLKIEKGEIALIR